MCTMLHYVDYLDIVYVLVLGMHCTCTCICTSTCVSVCVFLVVFCMISNVCLNCGFEFWRKILNLFLAAADIIKLAYNNSY